MLRITPRFGPYNQKGGAEVEQEENRSRSELGRTCDPPTRAHLGLLRLRLACAQYGRL